MLPCTMLNYHGITLYCFIVHSLCPVIWSLHNYLHIIRRFNVQLSFNKSELLSRRLKNNGFFNYWTTFISGYCKELEIFLKRGEKVDLLRSLTMTSDHPEWQRSSILYSTSSTGRVLGPTLVHFSRAACHEPVGLSRECQIPQATCYFVPQLLMNDPSNCTFYVGFDKRLFNILSS